MKQQSQKVIEIRMPSQTWKPLATRGWSNASIALLTAIEPMFSKQEFNRVSAELYNARRDTHVSTINKPKHMNLVKHSDSKHNGIILLSMPYQLYYAQHPQAKPHIHTWNFHDQHSSVAEDLASKPFSNVNISNPRRTATCRTCQSILITTKRSD